MKIGLIDIDGHNFPNLALMKISAYHKSIGDDVEWVKLGYYDIIYKSKIFSFSYEITTGLYTSKKIIEGGTGYSLKTKLPCYIDKLCPDYSIYPKFEEAYGFLTRGCVNKCSWCIVPQKEGKIKAYADIEEFLAGRKAAILMDNNILASEHGLKQLEKITRMKLRVDINQGLDARIIAKNEDIAELLSQIKWYKPIRMSCDSNSQMQYIEKATELLRKHKAVPKRYSVYVLLTNLADSYERINFCKSLKLDVFAQPYYDYNKNQEIPQWQKDMAQWVNKKSHFKSCDFKQYKPRKNFCCSKYFK